MTFTFGDRFSYNNPTFAALETAIESATDAQLINASPELNSLAQMVRRFSVLLKSTPVKQIYYAITDHADPEIGLILGSAKDSEGNWRYAGINDVKKFIYSPATGELVSEYQNKFADGIRRISACFAAAELISQFATLKEQLAHAEALKDRATSELKFLLEIPANAPSGSTSAATEDEVNTGRIYFQRLTHQLEIPLSVYITFPGTLSDLTPIVYTPGNLSTAEIVSDIADKINEASLTVDGGNLLASPVLSGVQNTHYIELSPRTVVVDRTATLITIQFKFQAGADYDSTELPFMWGLDVENMSKYPLNSVLLLTRATYFVASKIGEAQDTTQDEFLPTILYIRKNSLVNAPATDQYQLRFPVTDETIITVPFNRVTSAQQETLDAERYQQFALSLLNTITASRDENFMVSAIIRNDPSTAADPVAVLELFAWSVMNPQVILVLDILQVPADIEISLGDYSGPYSKFSNKPRSLRVRATYARAAETVTTTTGLDLAGTPKMVGFSRSKLLDNVNDATRQFEAMHDPFYFY